MTIALLTDFGLDDGFIGAVKGVIKTVNPDVDIIDISHGVTPFDILEGSIILKAVYSYFPEGTIFMSVVDPGVGTERKPIIVKTEKYIFVAPDNGLLTLALKNQKIERIIHITNGKYMLKRETETFHGRDIFAPVSAYLSKGEALENFGVELESYKKIDFPEAYVENGYVVGQIIKFDRFGNGITNLEVIPNFEEILFRDFSIGKICRTFLEGDRDKPNIIKGSFGFYEIFLPERNAKVVLRLKIGEKVRIKLKR